MVPFGGPGVMLLAVLGAGFVAVCLALLLGRRLGWGRAVLAALLLWSVACLVVITLVPANGPPGLIPPERAQSTCSFDYGGPAPDGFWIVGGGQRLLNVAVVVPSGLLLALLLSRFSRGLRWVPVGVIALALCSVAIEATQLELTRLGRACDITDVVDNTTGAVLGAAVGVVVGLLGRALVPLREPRQDRIRVSR